MSNRRRLVLAAVVVAALAPMVGVATPAHAAGTCIPANSGNVGSVEMVGEGQDGATFTCSYKSTGRGGITAATPNKWTMVNTRTGVTVADWNGGPMQSTNDDVCPGDVIEITFSSERRPGFQTIPAGTYGVIRAGGSGVVPYVDVLTPRVCDGL